MAYLDTYTTPLTAATAAHLLRRATFGPTQQEITSFTGKTAAEAVDILINNASFRANPQPPVELDDMRSDGGQAFLTKPFFYGRSTVYNTFIQYWWIGLMAEQTGKPSLLEKMAAFWQNHYVTAHSTVDDYRLTYSYLAFLRANALGNFKSMTVGMSKEPAMLIYLNGNENSKELANENFARELQELFVVGQKNRAGEDNYSEADVKAAARALTGWQVVNYKKESSTTFGAVFNSDSHDSTEKAFSAKYGNKSIAGQTGPNAGLNELNELINILVSHPESPKFICRKLYRWFVNTNVTDEIEQQVIIPLASFFVSSGFEITPVIKKLLTSQIFYDSRNIGALIKAPAEFMIGLIRIFDQPVPSLPNDYVAFRKMMSFLSSGMNSLQQNLLNQPSVFGFIPYYQTGYSKNWISGTSLGIRNSRSEMLVSSAIDVKPGYKLSIDILGKLQKIQPNFSDPNASPSITCEQVLAELSRNLFAVEFDQTQKDFLIDKILMMNSSPRTTWEKEWNSYRLSPTDSARQNTILWRCKALMKYMLRMAEFQLF